MFVVCSAGRGPGRDFDLPRHSHYSEGLPLWCFNIVGGEILTFPDTPTTRGLSLWCFNIVGGEILTFPDNLTTQGLPLCAMPMVFQHTCSGGRDFDLPRHSHYSEGLPLWCFNIVAGRT